MAKIRINAKKKLFISFAVFAVISLTAIFSLIAVLARRNTSLVSQINVEFYADNVSADITGKYWYDNSTTTMTAMTGGTNGTITFYGDEEEAKSLGVPTINLSPTNSKVVLEYAFKNLSSDSSFVIELKSSPKIKANAGQDTNKCRNMNENYYVSATQMPLSLFDSVELLSSLNVQQVRNQTSLNPADFDTVYIYVVASVANIANSAKYEGNFQWEMTHVADDDLSNPTITINLNNDGETGGLSSIKAITGTWGASNKAIDMPVLYDFPTKTDYGVDGYYTLADGGTKYISYFCGAPAHASDLTDGATLFVHWSPFVVSETGELSAINSTWLSGRTTVDIPDYVCSIDENVALFENNTDITTVKFPRSLTNLPANTFKGCTSLVTVTFGEEYANVVETASEDVTPKLDFAVSSNVQTELSSVDYVVQKKSALTTIGNSAFFDCSSLANISIPKALTEIGNNAFSNCSSLASIEIPKTATFVGTGIFDGCSNIDISGPVYTKSQLGSAINVSLKITGSSNVLPSAYQEVEYIESTGTQYIDTGYKYAGTTDEIYLDFVPNETENDKAFFGSCSSGSATFCELGQYNGYFRGNIDSNLEGTGKPSVTNGTRYSAKNLNGIWYIDGTSFGVTCTNACTVNCYLFGRNYANNGNSYYNRYSSCKVYSLTVVRSGEVVLNLVPCYRKSDSVIGMYDTVSGNFLTNLGDETFLKGADVGGYTVREAAFKDFAGLVSLELDGATLVGINAFASCTNLTKVENSNGLTKISNTAFMGCSSLVSITLPSTLGNIGSSAFMGCSSLAGIEIPNGVSNIGSSAFNGCTSLTEITIPSSVLQVRSNVFAGCTSLTSITLPSTVTTIADNAFSGCTSLTDITGPIYNKNCLPTGATGIHLTINGTQTTISASSFNVCSSLVTLHISEGIENILNNAFTGCANLVELSLPSTIKSIHTSAFWNTSSLTNLIFSENGNFKFYNGILYDNDLSQIAVVPKNLTGTLTISDKLGTKSLNAYDLTYLNQITELIIPEGIQAIGNICVNNCANLQIVRLPSTLISFDSGSMQNCPNLENVIIASGNTSFVNNGGIIYDTAETEIVFVPCALTVGSVVLPNTLTEIKSNAFLNNTGITSITIQSGVTKIGAGALRGKALQTVYIPSTVTEIGPMAFYLARSLTNIYFEDTTSTWTASSGAGGTGDVLDDSFDVSNSSAIVPYFNDYPLGYYGKYFTKNVQQQA